MKPFLSALLVLITFVTIIAQDCNDNSLVYKKIKNEDNTIVKLYIIGSNKDFVTDISFNISQTSKLKNIELPNFTFSSLFGKRFWSFNSDHSNGNYALSLKETVEFAELYVGEDSIEIGSLTYTSIDLPENSLKVEIKELKGNFNKNLKRVAVPYCRTFIN